MRRKRNAYHRGYYPAREIRTALKRFHQTNLTLTILTALADHATMMSAAGLGYACLNKVPLLVTVALQIPIFLLIARCLRGLENLVHEGAHYNWTRQPRMLNDTLCDLFAGWTVFNSTGRFRPPHVEGHHNRFGSPDDPDRRRYAELEIDHLDRSDGFRFACHMARVLPRYVLGWWIAIGSRTDTILKGLAWHLTTWILPVSTILGLGPALVIWLGYFVIPFALVLPCIRFVGEAGKHRYIGTETEFGATYSNLGIIHWLMYPHGDAFHALHHLFRAIPHHQLKRAHKELAKLDPGGYGANHQFRTRILQDPVTRQKEQNMEAIELRISEDILTRFPHVVVGAILVRDLDVAARQLRSNASLSEQARSVLLAQGLTIQNIADEPRVRGWRQALTSCELKASTFKSSPEQLARRLVKGDGVTTPLAVVNCYCSVSAKHLSPLGGYDVDRLPDSRIELRMGKPDYDRFRPLGGQDLPVTVNTPAYVLADGTVICWGFNHKDSSETCLTANTRVAVFLGEAVTPVQEDALRMALAELTGLLQVAGARVSVEAFANRDTPRFILPVNI